MAEISIELSYVSSILLLSWPEVWPEEVSVLELGWDLASIDGKYNVLVGLQRVKLWKSFNPQC